MENQKTLEDLYKQFCLQKRDAKIDLAKCMISNFTVCLAEIYPLFGIAMVPAFYYLSSFVYSYLNPIFTYKKQIKETIEILEFEKKFIYLYGDLKCTLEKIGVQSPIELFSFYYYLVLNGYLSLGHTFYAENSDKYDFSLKSSIIAGYGKCRNLSPFFVDLLNTFGYQSYNIPMFLDNTDIIKMTDDYFRHKEDLKQENIDITVPPASFNLKEMSRLFIERGWDYNHFVTLLANKEESYIMDAMNETFYLIANGKVYPFLGHDKVKTNLKKDAEKNKLPKVSSVGIKDFDVLAQEYLEAREKCDGYRDTFETFYLEHKDLYEDICHEREEIQKKYQKILSFVLNTK